MSALKVSTINPHLLLHLSQFDTLSIAKDMCVFTSTLNYFTLPGGTVIEGNFKIENISISLIPKYIEISEVPFTEVKESL